MPCLHLVQQTLSRDDFNKHCACYCNTKDSILFLNDAVFMLIEKDFNNQCFNELTSDITLLMIEEQAVARGVKSFVNPEVKQIDYQKFVEFSACSQKVISW